MAKKRATPSGFMMNGPTPSSGGVSGLMSGTSTPAHFCPFHAISLRLGSQGLPDGSQEARLYRIRRLAGHANAQPNVLPRPLGSELSRRAIMLPLLLQAPLKIQQPH